jgi:toxin-antitoxin system PIN domain toxin
MITIDTNLLIYAHRSGTREHRSARSAIETACGSAGGCAITLPSIAEFFSVVTHPAATGRPSSPGDAAAFLAALEEAGAIVLGPGPAFSTRLVQTAADLAVTGSRIFDLQIGLCALDGGATELWTHDANFVKIPGLVIRDPLR